MSGKTVVITGAASGIGFGLVQSFLARGWQVGLADVDQAALDTAIAKLNVSEQRVLAVRVDVTQYEALAELWCEAVNKWGRVDVWINNAGISAPIDEISCTEPGTLNKVIEVNVNGVVNGTHVAVKAMQRQGGGYIYNMSGFGGEGTMRPGMVIYGTSKRAVSYFSAAVAKECKHSAVKIGWINPGMVITPMVINDAKCMGPEKWAQGRKVFNWFGETVETTCKQLVERIEANTKNGKQIHLLPFAKIIWRILSSLFRKRDVVKQFGI